MVGVNPSRLASRVGGFVALAVVVGVPIGVEAAVVVFQANGPNALSIQSNVDAFRAALGANNGTGPGPFVGGRREINWDGVPDALSSPNSLPGDFFNQLAAPRARGANFATPGSGFQVSANLVNPTSTLFEFGNIDSSYPAAFAAFSPQRLFTPVGSTITDVTFAIPGTPATPATVNGFGAVFTDVDLGGSTSLEFLAPGGERVWRGSVPAFTQGVPGSFGQETFSFLGVFFNAGEQIERVRIVSGNTALGAGVIDNPGAQIDVVALDDFIYGEPVPEPATLLLLAAGALLLVRRRLA